MATGKNSENQVMDVSKPGKVPADSSSRPIIVGHGPLVQDPMVISAEETNPEQTNEEIAVNSPAASKKVISPLSQPETKEDDSSDSKTEDTESKQSDAEPKASDSFSETADVDSVVNQVDIGSKREAEQQAEAERKKQEALNKLIAEKKYFVPIGKTHKKAGRGIMIVTILLLIIFVALIAAIDAKILEVSFELPFDLIK